MEEKKGVDAEQQDHIDGSDNSQIYNKEVVRYVRSFPPVHFSLRMKNFSTLSSSKIVKYKSSEFEVGGYKWRLCVYPNGNKKANVNDHISLYLSIVHGSNNCPLKFGWEVHAIFKFFVYDHIRDNYLTIKDDNVEPKRFHRMKTKYGFDRLVSLATLNDPSSGYLRRGCCEFGAEIFVMQQPNGKGECLSTSSLCERNTFAMKFSHPSYSSKEFNYLEEFIVGNCKWKLCLNAKGQSTSKDKDIALFLHFTGSESLPIVEKVYAEFKLRFKDQKDSNCFEKTSEHLFVEGGGGYGYPDFILLKDLTYRTSGYIVEVEFTHISVSTDYC